MSIQRLRRPTLCWWLNLVCCLLKNSIIKKETFLSLLFLILEGERMPFYALKVWQLSEPFVDTSLDTPATRGIIIFAPFRSACQALQKLLIPVVLYDGQWYYTRAAIISGTFQVTFFCVPSARKSRAGFCRTEDRRQRTEKRRQVQLHFLRKFDASRARASLNESGHSGSGDKKCHTMKFLLIQKVLGKHCLFRK